MGRIITTNDFLELLKEKTKAFTELTNRHLTMDVHVLRITQNRLNKKYNPKWSIFVLTVNGEDLSASMTYAETIDTIEKIYFGYSIGAAV